MTDKRKIALFKSVEYGWINIKSAHPIANYDGYVRVSEIVEIEFQPLLCRTVVNDESKILDKSESELRAKFSTALDVINDRRQNLKALTVPGTNEDIKYDIGSQNDDDEVPF